MRKTIQTIWHCLCCLMLLAAWGVAPINAQTTEQRELHETYNLSPNGQVSVSNSSGYIRVTTWNENRVQVDAVKRARRDEDWRVVELRVLSRPERLEIQTIYPRGRMNSTSVDYDLKVPRSAVLDAITSTSGDVTITGPVARVSARSTSGNVTVTDISGDANLASTSGNVRAERIGGALSLTSTSGNVTVNEVASRLNARSTSGSIRATQIRDDASAHCTSGSIRLENVGGRANVHNTSGGIALLNVSGDAQVSTISETASVENVRGRVIATSISGALIIRKADEGVRATSVSGNLEISQTQGRIDAETVSGNIILREVDSHELRLKSLSSSVRYQGKLHADGFYEFQSHSGDVVVTAPPESEFNLSATSFSGSINSDFPIQLTSGNLSRRGPVQGSVGKGGAQVKATSFSGSVYLKKLTVQR